MKVTKLRRYVLTFILTMILPAQAPAITFNTYEGQLGKQRIGLDLITPDTGRAAWETRILRAYYFYANSLQDIPLKVVKQDGRHITLSEVGENDIPKAILNIEFPSYDVLHFYRGTEESARELKDPGEIVGTWEAVDGKRELSVQLHVAYASFGEDNRCGLDAAKTKHLENRVRLFQREAIAGDLARLKSDFHTQLPSDSRKRQAVVDEIAHSVPHEMFCRDVGVLFGSTWFDYDGNIIK